MPIELLGLRVFVASPGGLEIERDALRQEAHQLSEMDGHDRGFTFIPLDWHSTRGGMGRPQKLVDEDLRQCDYTVILLHDRWGSAPSPDPNSPYTSGTEEEFYIALECLADLNRPMRNIAVLFRGVDATQLRDPGPELKQVIAFRRKLEDERQILFSQFDDVDEFRTHMRRYLIGWLRDEERLLAIPTIPKMPAATNAATANEAVLAPLEIRGLLTEAEVRAAEQMTFEDAASVAKYLRSLLAASRFNRLKHFADDYLSSIGPVDEPAELSVICTIVGQSLRRQGQLKESITYLERAVSLAEEADSDGVSELVAACDHLGLTLRRCGLLDRAKRIFLRGIDVALANALIGQHGQLLTDLALCHRDACEFERAQMLLNVSLSLLDRKSEPHRRAITLAALGTVQADLGKIKTGLKRLDSAVKLNRSLDDNYGLAIALGQRAAVLLADGKLTAARSDAQECYRLNVIFQSREGLATALMLLGRATLHQSATAGADAANYLVQAMEIAKGIDHDYLSIVSAADLALALSNHDPGGSAWALRSGLSLAKTSQVMLAKSYIDRIADTLAPVAKEQQ